MSVIPARRESASADILPGRWQRIGRALRAEPIAATGSAIFLFFGLVALLGPLLAPHGLNEQFVTAARQPPSADFFFGTDHLGRDVFSRLLHGARDIFILSGSGTILSVLLGTTIGLLSGTAGGWLDEVMMRLLDSLLAIPALLFALLLLGLNPGSRSSFSVILVLVFVYTPIVARVVRSVVLSVRNLPYIEAARVQGERLPWLLFREILPAVLPALTVEAALRFSYAIFLVASLGFLGVGLQPPSPNWGLMVKEARPYVTQIPWALWFPAGAIALLVVGTNLMADGLRRILQPD
jgi:peptide/nickel transport system permease protein